MKNNVSILRISILSLMLTLFAAPVLEAQTCTGFGSFLRDKWEDVYQIAHPIGEQALTLIPVVGQNQAAVDAISAASSEFHDFVFDGNNQSWTTIGNRALPVLDEQIKQYGTLRKVGVGGVRTFVTTGLFWDRVELEIEKKDGRAETEIIICTWDMASGAKNNYAEYTFPNGKNLSKKKWVIQNMHGKALSVKLRNRSVTNTFKYAIKTKGFLNINKQRARGQQNVQSGIPMGGKKKKTN